MLITDLHPTVIYSEERKACEVAASLAAQDTDGWTYRAETRAKGRWVIACYDREGEFVGYM
jgi:hypothetical protein